MKTKLWMSIVLATSLLAIGSGCDKLKGEDASKGSDEEPAANEQGTESGGPTAVSIVHACADLGPIALVVDGKTPKQIAKIVPFDGRPVEVTIASGRRTVEISPADRVDSPEATLVRSTLVMVAGDGALLVIAGLAKPLKKGDRRLSMRLIYPRGNASPEAGATTSASSCLPSRWLRPATAPG